MASLPFREIDKLPTVSPRPKEMEVLALGLSRTATMSLYTALGILGYKSYHGLEMSRNLQDRHFQCWHEALTTKLTGKGTPYGPVEFDKLLGKYSAVTDAPCTNFSAELLAAYPEAKVILTSRDSDKWIESIERSYFYVLNWWAWKVLAAIDNNIGAYTGVLRMILTDWSSGNYRDRRALRRGFLAHNAHIRAVVPKNNLLDFTPQQGWEPLCKFLGKEVPEVPFPRVNEGDATADIHRAIMGRKVRAYWGRWRGVVVAVAVAVAGIVVGVGFWVSGSSSK